MCLLQWKEQIRTHTKGGILEPVMVYHGPNRSSHANAFSKANVVITSFSVVEVCVYIHPDASSS